MEGVKSRLAAVAGGSRSRVGRRVGARRLARGQGPSQTEVRWVKGSAPGPGPPGNRRNRLAGGVHRGGGEPGGYRGMTPDGQ